MMGGELDENTANASYKFDIRDFALDAGHLLGKVGEAPYAQGFLDCIGADEKTGVDLKARIKFIEGTISKPPSVREITPSGQKLIEAEMHCSMIPLVLGAIMQGGAFLTFQPKSGEPVVNIKAKSANWADPL